ncbi:uncharacterized protein LOC131234735 [Magnolia sinica]|uniref:uncharacterized protein LOC131234735 n=1 Tax=Magnolia sinica TaxID=86752 RepID=UPI002658E853|nr:uncharacterized protein LOC131234735 [Magnolia sinica]
MEKLKSPCKTPHMERGEEASPPNPNPKSSLCQECSQNPSKYTCPGCSLRTCSLPCVKSHKQRTSCTGKRLRTAFIPLSQFDDNLLISDYNFLEETKRAAESAQRMRDGLFGNYGFRLPIRLKLLRNAAGRRKTRLLVLPSGMEKREKNRSIFHQRKKSIFWTIEWRFHSTDVVLIDHGVDEHEHLVPVIEKHLKPGPWNNQLKPFCKEPLDSLKFFIQKNPKGLKSPFRELNIKDPISLQLAGVVIIEFPVIHVFLPSHSYDFEVEKDANTFSKVEKAEPFNDIPSPKGVLFREEEIDEDDATFDTQVMDFMNYMNPEPLIRDKVVEKEASLSTRAFEVTRPVSESNVRAFKGEEMIEYFHCSMKASEEANDMDFDFEQDLRDAYSDLIGQVNPDDFLCLDGGFVDEEDGRSGDCSVFDGEVLRDEELEEGEIPES